MSLTPWRFRFRKYVRNPVARAPGRLLCWLGLHRWAADLSTCVRSGCHLEQQISLAMETMERVLFEGFPSLTARQMGEVVKSRTGGRVDFKPERILRALRSLEQRGVVEQGWEVAVAREPHFRLTEAHRQHLVQLACEHDIRPVDEDWGRCVKCEADGFPLTEMAAYGEVQCSTCHDTGSVPVFMESRPGAFASGPCSDCESWGRP